LPDELKQSFRHENYVEWLSISIVFFIQKKLFRQ